MPRGTRFSRHKIHIGMYAIGDEHLASVDDPLVAVLAGGGAHTGHIRARAWLADAHGGDQFATDNPRQIFGFLRSAARMVQVRAGHVGVNQHRDDEAAKGGLAQGLGKHQVG